MEFTDRIVLDVHAHLAPIDESDLGMVPGVSWGAAEEKLFIDGHALEMKPLFRPDALRSWMVNFGIDHAWISVPPPMYRQHLRGSEAESWNQYLNRGLQRLTDASEGKFSPLVHLPTESPDLASAVVQEWTSHGHRLFAMPAGTGDDRQLSATEFEPLWAALDDAEAFVFLHPGECCDGRLAPFYLKNLLGNPYESTVALSHMILGGVLDRYKRFVPCIAHGGGLLPTVAARFERGFDTARPGVDLGIGKPSSVLNRIHVDCICHSEAAITHAEFTFGENNVLFGSDWPFPMGIMEPDVQLSGYDDTRLKRITSTNPNRLRLHYT